jgi:hypothetical protein
VIDALVEQTGVDLGWRLIGEARRAHKGHSTAASARRGFGRGRRMANGIARRQR